MKKLILSAALLLGAATVVQAQKKAIEIKRIEKQHVETLPDGKVIAADGNHEFAIHANEEANVNLTFFLKTDGDLSVLVKTKNEKVIHSRKFTKKDANKMSFTMDENEEYTISLSSVAHTKFSVSADENL